MSVLSSLLLEFRAMSGPCYVLICLVVFSEWVCRAWDAPAIEAADDVEQSFWDEAFVPAPRRRGQGRSRGRIRPQLVATPEVEQEPPVEPEAQEVGPVVYAAVLYTRVGRVMFDGVFVLCVILAWVYWLGIILPRLLRCPGQVMSVHKRAIDCIFLWS